MKFYNSLGPNPRLVRMFMLEKGIEIPFEEVDLMAGANREPAYMEKNPTGQMPSLELDDGTVIAETVPICEYLEEIHPDPALIGSSPQERAETRMWTRRIELNITEPLANGFRYGEGLDIFKDRLHVIPQAADDLKAIARENLERLDGWLEGRDFVAGNRLTLADIVLYAITDFGPGVGQPLDPSLKRVGAWSERVGSRPSAEASLHPVAVAGGMRG
ncbi:MAG: glutathione S-transferase family protein [Deltaproteobacteria bacterium]|nr:glutathione S-transferase family protein [Deltaproteobacteria bacterium]MBW2412999.1 glutathione S-transferase family protein [Deltaproteobacteria bacterium]